MNSPYFNLANELESMFRDWNRQDDEYGSAVAGLEPCDRDPRQEQIDMERVNRSREKQIKKTLEKHGFVLNPNPHFVTMK